MALENNSGSDPHNLLDNFKKVISVFVSLLVFFKQIPEALKWGLIVAIIVYLIFVWPGKKNRMQLLTWSITVFLSFVVITTWIVTNTISKRKEKEAERVAFLQDQRKTPLFSKDDNRYKILIIPFSKDDEGKPSDITEVLGERLKELSQKENLDLLIKGGSQLANSKTGDSLEYWTNFHHADLVIWGRYFPLGPDSLAVKVKYNAAEKELLSNMYKSNDTGYVKTTLFRLSKGELQGSIDFVIQFIAAFREYDKNEYQSAIRSFLRIMNTYNQDVVDFYIGTSYSYLGDCKKSAEYLELAVSKQPYFVMALTNLGATYYSCGKPKEALTEYEISLRIDSLNPVTWYNLGVLKMTQKDYHAAIAGYNKALSLDPNHFLAAFNRGFAKYALGDFMNAGDDFSTAIRLNHGFSLAYYNRGTVSGLLKRYREAIADLSRAIALDPGFVNSYLTRGNIYFDLLLIDSARADYLKVLELDSMNAMALTNLGELKFRTRDFEGAIREYTKVTRINPVSVNGYYGLALVLTEQKKFKEALVICNKMVKIAPSRTSGYYARCSVYYLLQMYKEALVDCNKVIKLDPLNNSYYTMRGKIKRKLKDYKGALADLNKAIVYDSTNAAAWFNRSIVKTFLKDFKGAAYDKSKTDRLAPGNSEFIYHFGANDEIIN